MTRLYVGTYTRPMPFLPRTNGDGLYVLDYDDADGSLRQIQTVRGIENPSYLHISRGGRDLHALWEVQGWQEGLISSYAIDADGTLTYQGVQGSRGGLPCHVTMDSRSRAAFISNYGSGSVAMLPAGDDGALRQASSFDQHTGTGPDPTRQEGPHAHCTAISADDAYAFSTDLGIDKVIGYRIDYERMELTRHSELELPGASGPRHLTFSPDGRHAYVTNELASTVAALAYDAETGSLALIDIYPMLPADFEGESYASDIHVHPSGRFLYGANRGHDSITMFTVERHGAQLDVMGHRSTEGATPRNFAIAPDGRFLLVANQDSDNVVVMAIDQASGNLGETVAKTEVPTPVCLKFAPGGTA